MAFQSPTAYPVFFRTYSRMTKLGRESWKEVCNRTIDGISALGRFTPEERVLLTKQQEQLKVLPSGRWLWVGGTKWIDNPKNYPGAYNCTSTNLEDWEAFALMMDLAMMGCGTGAIIEPQYYKKLPIVYNHINVEVKGNPGDHLVRTEHTIFVLDYQNKTAYITVGDSRKGWVDAYAALLSVASDIEFLGRLSLVVDVGSIRKAGEKLKQFGGIANPAKIKDLFYNCVKILNKAIGKQLNSVECCLLIDEAASVVVAGNIRRSAGMRQFSSGDGYAAIAKDNLWQQDTEGNWRIDPDRDALRMANHTRVFHHKPSLEECISAVEKQYYSGEGAIQWAGEAVARANADLLIHPEAKADFIKAYNYGKADVWFNTYFPTLHRSEISERLSRYGLNPCGEIIGNNFFCNLSEVHLNTLNPNNHWEQEEAFKAGALSVAALLNHKFVVERYRKSREADPIVGVSFTGLFDFFVNAFGVKWLQWWEQGRPQTPEGLDFKVKEQEYLSRWKKIVHDTVWAYCDKHGLKRPNRCTTVQPSGTKSLLTGASPGWHPPKAQRYIRRITFRKNDPVALACIDYGYNVVPSQTDKDEFGNLLNDPFDSRCTEWLVEIPVAVNWAGLPGADKIDVSKFSVLAQFDFLMQVQKFYTTHNTSATLELRVNEINALGMRIYDAIKGDEGYISAALLARFDDLQTFPRLPFEPIDEDTYNKLVQEVEYRSITDDFQAALAIYDSGQEQIEAGPAGCDSDKCMLPLSK
ncbi:ribonucleoside-triphosphate reductase [Cylindrospermopsis phage Cr-LKS4]|nr:ribonucleoside-triphosphate reductase [Cylindrospermopsis phage Cr-LKS4]